MRRTVLPSINQPLPQAKNLTQGYQRFQPLREFMYRNNQGQKVTQAVWHDWKENKSYYAGHAWDFPPPDLPSGDEGREPRCAGATQRYRNNYARIFGHG